MRGFRGKINLPQDPEKSDKDNYKKLYKIKSIVKFCCCSRFTLVKIRLQNPLAKSTLVNYCLNCFLRLQCKSREHPNPFNIKN